MIKNIIVFSTVMIYQFIQEAEQDNQTMHLMSRDIQIKINQIDDGFINRVVDKFKDQMYGFESLLDKSKFISNLQKEEFKWLFDSQACRDQVNDWIKNGFS